MPVRRLSRDGRRYGHPGQPQGPIGPAVFATSDDPVQPSGRRTRKGVPGSLDTRRRLQHLHLAAARSDGARAQESGRGDLSLPAIGRLSGASGERSDLYAKRPLLRTDPRMAGTHAARLLLRILLEGELAGSPLADRPHGGGRRSLLQVNRRRRRIHPVHDRQHLEQLHPHVRCRPVAMGPHDRRSLASG